MEKTSDSAAVSKPDNLTKIISWNVAGITPTLSHIKTLYGDFPKFLADMRVTILALQEVKITPADLANLTKTPNVGEDYDVFYSPSELGSNFNGVATIVRKGMTNYADPKPLRDEVFDREGRCIMTSHGPFSLFNVYAPNGGGQNSTFESKLRFYKLLEAAMERERASGKDAILVGDMNNSMGYNDVYPLGRRLRYNRVLESVRKYNDKTEWKVQLSNHLEKILASLKEGSVVKKITKNPTTNKEFEKFQFQVKSPADSISGGKVVNLGQLEEDESHVFDFDFGEVGCEVNGEYVRCREGETIRLFHMVELMNKLTPKSANIVWDDELVHEICKDEDAKNLFAPTYIIPYQEWLLSLLESTKTSDTKMIDTFRHFYPSAEGRYTIYNQYKNERYVNNGCRIDFVLVDEAFRAAIDCVEANRERLGCGKDEAIDHNCFLAGLHAATFSGEWKMVSFAGGGMQFDYSDAACKSIFSQNTMIQTPPKLSDHTAVSCLFNLSKMGPKYNDVNARKLVLDEKKSRSAQPHKKQKTIMSMFGGRAAMGNGGSSSVNSAHVSGNSNGKSRSAFSSTTIPKQRHKKLSTVPVSDIYRKTTGFVAKADESEGNEKEKTLTSMGFSKSDAADALRTCGGDISSATEFLLGGKQGGGGGFKKPSANLANSANSANSAKSTKSAKSASIGAVGKKRKK